MSELGDLLALLHGARDRVSTVRATVRMWHDVARTRAAMERRRNVVAYPPADDQRERESVVRVWLAPPDRAREERDGEGYGVRRGQVWWTYDPSNGARSNEDCPEIGSGGTGEELWWLLDPAPIIGLLDFDDATRGERAGRATIRVRAVPRGGDDWSLVRLTANGADELWLEIDAEKGALLRIESLLDGQPYAIYEVLEVAFDEAFTAEVFAFMPPPGEAVRSATSPAGPPDPGG